MKIEAVTVCIGYADFLAETVKYNAGMFERRIIVTSPDDHATRHVCRRYSLQTLLSEDHKRDDPKGFNKGRLIERGLQHLSADAWRVHLDGDIVLPPRFHHLMRSAQLDPRKIYGCDRIMVRSYDEWKRLQNSGWMANSDHCMVNPPPGFQIGQRWAHHDGGYVPIGFFQLWHSSQDLYYGARIRPYPATHNDACRTDVQHALQWDRKHRELIPELLAVHLESESSKTGANWCGRTTKPFGPCAPKPVKPYGE